MFSGNISFYIYFLYGCLLSFLHTILFIISAPQAVIRSEYAWQSRGLLARLFSYILVLYPSLTISTFFYSLFNESKAIVNTLWKRRVFFLITSWHFKTEEYHKQKVVYTLVDLVTYIAWRLVDTFGHNLLTKCQTGWAIR